ncbi:MAG: hypothetical protein JRG73_15990 [Deltaproteobacteria bacterium]|nr:hypothetical protein [Deltaproteobacteria bacterium]
MKSWAASEAMACLEVLAAVGFDATEMERWPCCGAADPLVEENLIKMVAPFRILSRAAEMASRLLTLCPICHRVLRTVLLVITRDQDKRAKLEDFCQIQAPARLEVIHWIQLMTRPESIQALAHHRKLPDGWLRVMPYPGCAMLRPREVLGMDNPERPNLLETVLSALGMDPALNSRRVECCGGHQGMVDPEGVQRASIRILEAARMDGCRAVITPCPLCRHNLQKANGEGAFVDAVVSAAVAAAMALGVPPQRFLVPGDSRSLREWENLQALIPCPA